MIKALYIVGAIAALMLLLSLIKVTVSISYVNELEIALKVFLFKLKIYPFEEKITEKKPKQQVKEKKHKHVKKKQKPPKPKPPLKDTLLLLKEFLYEVVSKFGRFVRLEEYRVKVLVATDDVAKTGVLYGAVCGVMASISFLIDRIKRKSVKKDRIYTEVVPDFIAEEPELFISIALSMRVWQMFSIGLTASKSFLKYNSLVKIEKEESKQEEEKTSVAE